jgi:hypothetical protein
MVAACTVCGAQCVSGSYVVNTPVQVTTQDITCDCTKHHSVLVVSHVLLVGAMLQIATASQKSQQGVHR